MTPETDAPHAAPHQDAPGRIPVEDAFSGLLKATRQASRTMAASLGPALAALPARALASARWRHNVGGLSLWALRQLARNGNQAARRELGYRLANGDGTPADPVAAFQWFRHGARDGDAACQYALGVMYANGQGVPESKLRAIAWYEKAAAQGHAVAQFNLALLYDLGDGIDRNGETAFRWYHCAASQGYPRAAFNLGVLYETGDEREPDLVQALDHYAQAAECGFALAQLRLGQAFLEGAGRPASPADAWFWFSLAATALPPGDEAERAEHGREMAQQGMTLAEIEAARLRLRHWPQVQ